VVAEPGSRRGGGAVAAERLVHYETAVVTTWCCGCCYQVAMVKIVVGAARDSANERYCVVERRSSRAVVTIDTVLVTVGCQLVT